MIFLYDKTVFFGLKWEQIFNFMQNLFLKLNKRLKKLTGEKLCL